jgi:aminopeptidase S
MRPMTGDATLPALARRAFPATGCVLVVACASISAPTAAPPTAAPTAGPTAVASTPSPTATTPTTTPSPLTGDALAALVDAASMLEHLEALQAIADDHQGNRATGSVGFEASVTYVMGQLIRIGYAVERRSFQVGGAFGVNLITQRRGAEEGVVMLGAHLDSVVAGPGINDNGSGVAALLVIAEQLHELPAPRRTVRFAFWGAEEGGPFGSAAYVDALDPDDRARIVAYLNFDMLASPNAVRFVYDEAGAAPGSQELTDRFVVALEQAGLAWEPIDLEGDSDHGPFIEAGIPTGGLFSGGIEPLTVSQAEVSGAVAGEPADACSHRACDTIDNVDVGTLEEMARVIARVLVTLAAAP